MADALSTELAVASSIVRVAHGPVALPSVVPGDPADLDLLVKVRPLEWINPPGSGIYDLVVLGGGTAGLVSAMGAAGLGARVALVERDLLGGDCLNTGCVPSKALIRSARVAGELSRAAALGVSTGEVSVDFVGVMRRMRERRALIAEHDSAKRLQRAGVDVFFGIARFADARTVAVDGRQLRFRKAVIATGSRPTAPPIPGLDQVSYLTNETVFSLTHLPPRLLVIGAGPVGCELAQAFVRFGAMVTLFDQAAEVLPREDADAAALVRQQLERDGVRCELNSRLQRVEQRPDGVRLWFAGGQNGSSDGECQTGDAILVAAGRRPNVEDLDLQAAGIRVDTRGVIVDDRLRTSNPRVFASGDVCSDFKFTHAADALSRIVIQNALFFGRRKATALVIPWVTYTDPEVAHVGANSSDQTRSPTLSMITIGLHEVDRSIVDDEIEGFVRVHHDRGRLRGCTIVAPHAGEMIGEVVYAMTHGGTLGSLSAVVHPYPTVAEALRKAGDSYRRQRLTPGLRTWLERYFRWTR